MKGYIRFRNLTCPYPHYSLRGQVLINSASLPGNRLSASTAIDSGSKITKPSKAMPDIGVAFKSLLATVGNEAATRAMASPPVSPGHAVVGVDVRP